jgi:hypothetical protein
MAGTQSTGQCELCGKTFNKAAMTRHLQSCTAAAKSSRTAGSRGARAAQAFHLVVEGRYLPDYWLHLEAAAGSTLEDLDGFLRRTWLECCGHMSAFRIGTASYSGGGFGGDDDLFDESMDIPLAQVLQPGSKLKYEYDFGSTTDLVLKVVAVRPAESKRHYIKLLARNLPPPIACDSCQQPATQVCTECPDDGWLCDACVETHECSEEMRLPVVNSPRVGVCGYTG